jgi:hypothetical protein
MQGPFAESQLILMGCQHLFRQIYRAPSIFRHNKSFLVGMGKTGTAAFRRDELPQ